MIFSRGHFNNTLINESFINESLNEVRLFSARNAQTLKTTIFLSHKHSDLADLRGVMGMLEKLGVKIYIDSMDNKMPSQTSGETANRIKEVIKFCDKFILLATEKAIESYWCNWELGFGDTHKYIDKIAILPMKESNSNDSDYRGNEYLQIYPSIDYYDGTTYYRNSQERIKEGYYVCKPKDKSNVRIITPLQEWLKK